MDQCWWLQPEPTALFLYKHKTKDKKKKKKPSWSGVVRLGGSRGQERVVVWASVARSLENKGNDFKLKQKCRSPIQPSRLLRQPG